MNITQPLKLDMQIPHTRQILRAKQGDTLSRTAELQLFDGGTIWNVPADATILQIVYCKPDRHGGCYDTMPDDSAACTVSGNVVTAKLHPQMFTVAGTVVAELRLLSTAGGQLGTFTWYIAVEASAASNIAISEDYYRFASLDSLRVAVDALTGRVETLEGRALGARTLICLLCRYGADLAETTAMPTSGVWQNVELYCEGDASPEIGDVIVGSNGYCAVYGISDGSYTLTGTGAKVAPDPDNNAVRYSAQTKTTDEQAQARQNINAADGGILNPFGEALSGFADGDVTGLPVVDPDAETGYIAATVSRAATEQAGQAVSIPTTGYLAAAIAAEIGEAIGGAY